MVKDFFGLTRRLQRGFALFVVATVIGAPLLPARPAFALSVNYIFSDSDLFDATAMSASRIQNFLIGQESFLADYSLNDGGAQKRAADIIADVSRDFNLNPKFFLVLLQKEQSLITDRNPTQNQLDYALGYGCPSSCSAAYRGFGVQLRSAADRIHNTYLPALNSAGQFNGWGPGITKRTIDGVEVTPANIATAILYIYNPYVGKYGGGDQRWGANSLFQRLWTSWFAKIHPDGSLLRAKGQATVWLIRDGQRSAFKSRAAFFANYESSKIIVIDRSELENYPVGPALTFPEPSLVQTTTGDYFLLVNNEKRPIASNAVLRNLGYNPEEIVRNVKTEELAAYPTGTTLTKQNIYPTGRLLRFKSSGGVVYVDSNNVRHAIHSKEILRSRFPGQHSEAVSDRDILALSEGDPVKFKDGELVRSAADKHVYVVSNGTLRSIPNIEVFRQLGYQTKNIIKTNQHAIEIHPLGNPLSDILP